MNSLLLYAFLALALCSLGSSTVLDRCLVPMLKADLSFTLVDFGNSNQVHQVEFKPAQNALIKGYGKWKFSVVQNTARGGRDGLMVLTSCVDDCPDEKYDLPATVSVIFRTETQLKHNLKLSLHGIKSWNTWRDSPGAGVFLAYEDLTSSIDGQKVTVSFTLNVPRPFEKCTNIDADKARSEFADLCFKSIDSNEDMATILFRGRNFSVYPSVLRKHSVPLGDLLDIHMENEEPLMIDLREFSADVGRMFLEVLCSGVIKATVNDNRAQHVSNLMKLYELGHKYQMDNIMLGAIDCFKNLYPKPTGSEAYDFVDLLAILKSKVGDDFRDHGIEVRIKSEHDEPTKETKQESEPQSRFKKLINRFS